MQAMSVLAMMGQTELLLVLAVILLLFGAKKLPELARSLGRSIGEFKKGQREGAAGDAADNAVRREGTTDAAGAPPEKKKAEEVAESKEEAE